MQPLIPRYRLTCGVVGRGDWAEVECPDIDAYLQFLSDVRRKGEWWKRPRPGG